MGPGEGRGAGSRSCKRGGDGGRSRHQAAAGPSAPAERGWTRHARRGRGDAVEARGAREVRPRPEGHAPKLGVECGLVRAARNGRAAGDGGARPARQAGAGGAPGGPAAGNRGPMERACCPGCHWSLRCSLALAGACAAPRWEEVKQGWMQAAGGAHTLLKRAPASGAVLARGGALVAGASSCPPPSSLPHAPSKVTARP